MRFNILLINLCVQLFTNIPHKLNYMNAVHGSIIENLRGIEIVYQETVPVFRNDKTNTSDSREVTVSQFIRSYLPADFQVKERTKIYSKTQETNNIDCVVLAPNHPPLITPVREVVLAEGVFVALEVKPDIANKSEFLRGLKQIKSVKNVNRKIEALNILGRDTNIDMKNYFEKIPCVLFSSKSSSVETTIQFLIEQYQQNILEFDEFPDLIVALDKAVIVYLPFFKQTPMYQELSSDYKNRITEKVFLVFESSDKATLLSLFLDKFLSLKMPTLLLSAFIVKDYLEGIIKESNQQSIVTCRIMNLGQ